MKIGFYGNPGNYPLMLARALRRLGHEVVFTLLSEAPLDRPENRYADLGPPYPEWIRDFSRMWKAYFPTPWRRRCIRLLQRCDLVVLSQIGPSLACEIGRPAVAHVVVTDIACRAWACVQTASLLKASRHPERRHALLMALSSQFVFFGGQARQVQFFHRAPAHHTGHSVAEPGIVHR